jgi:hypothetical protein
MDVFVEPERRASPRSGLCDQTLDFRNQREVHQVDRGVAFVGLPPEDERRVKAAIGIMSVHKLLPTPWRVCPLEEADLVILAPNNSASVPLLDSALQRIGSTTAALVTTAEATPTGCERLLWPLRAHALRNLLLNVEERMARGKGGTATGAPETSSAGGSAILAPLRPGSLLELAHVLRLANEPDSHGCAWIVRDIAPTPLYIASRTAAFLFEGSLSSLRNLPRDRSLEIAQIPEQDLPDGGAGKPLIMLQWHVGILLGQKDLLPWLDPEAAYSLRGWPDFAVLKHTPDHQRIAALLANDAANIPDIVRLAQVQEPAVNEFLNAASLTGRLLAVSAPQNATSRRPPSLGDALLQHLRGALGMGARR